MNLNALMTDVYFWVALALFIVSIAGVFWIMKSLQAEAPEHESFDFHSIPTPMHESPSPLVRTVQMPMPGSPAPRPHTMESLARQIILIDETLTKIEKKLNEQNTDQLNEMAGQMKLIVQMLKTIYSATGGDTGASMQQRVDKIYQILSTLSHSETK